MAAEVAARPQGKFALQLSMAPRFWSCPEKQRANSSSATAERPPKKKPFAAWVKRITNLKGNDDSESGKKKRAAKHKKNNTHESVFQNNPYPESGPLQQRVGSPVSSANGNLTPTSRPHDDAGSFNSVLGNGYDDRDGPSNNNKSGAPTLATKPGTIHSDAGHSKAATTTTREGALSGTDGAGAGSTFSSPAPSERSLTTTLTTIQSQSTGNVLQNGASGHHNNHHHGSLNNPNPVMFSHQYPTSPAPSTLTASAIPRHISEAIPSTYSSATANNLLSDDASIMTLASSSKRRRRSMDTDASVRALPPNSLWGGSRESLPLSVLSGNLDIGASGPSGLYSASQSRPSIGGLASTERASIYSSQGVSAPALASERNSFYSHKPAKDFSDGKSLRSITGLDARSQYDARSINDAKSQVGDVASLKNYEGSVKSGALGHSRNDSLPGSIGSPLASPGLRQPSTSGALNRRSSEWQELQEREAERVHGQERDENREPDRSHRDDAA
ncbi:hypothetical protein LTR56_008491 [Elasticomyces elasticus]|nr:hypothetical protein LTR56_008491 [Elasticomyces elasticus]KAK3653717.1 hypothetical protein LTR22_011094 [Elasticomyces elasticus]KAK4924174.1 hypothetical protein LTR49_008695 [Elasticomyces elasticus]KAK5758522.1 hypothetical protein LTS12_011386 [Elasticomyces elasticus]